SCYIDAAGICTPALGPKSTIVLSAKPLLLPDRGTIYQRLLAIILDYPDCGMSASVTEAEVRTNFLGPNGDGRGGVAAKYTNCSFGKFNLNATAFKVITVRTTCSNDTTKCQYWNLATDGNIGAKAQLGDAEYLGFTHYAYIVPPRMTCPWAGLGIISGRQIWLHTSGYGLYRSATIMQEAIHNYGLWHSWRNGVEYEDYSTPMGRGNVCPNAPELAYMGWATAAQGADRINSRVLSVGAPLTFNLPATYLGPNGSYIRIIPDWMPMYSNSTLAKNLYIAVRVNKGGDAGLAVDYTRKANVHEIHAAVVRGGLDYAYYFDANISFIGGVTFGTQMDFTKYNLVVYAGSFVAMDVLRVVICRYRSSAQECPSLTAVDVPAPPRPSPPPPSPPSPQPPPSIPPSPRPPRSPPRTPPKPQSPQRRPPSPSPAP
ncbi:metalloproteinase, extracellular matrix glycoprotein VMP32, partial [Volvox carteri f. nagariensis]